MSSRRFPLGPIVALIVFGAAIRVFRHFGVIPLPPNVAPVSAMAFLAAAYFPRRWGWMVPLGLMLASDIAIGGYTWEIMVVVYASFGISFLLGQLLRRRRTPIRLVTVSLLGSTVFYLLTNAAVWLWSGMYQRSWAGLSAAYLAGLPFFRNTIIGDLAFSLGLFGLVGLVVVYWRRQVITTRLTNHG